MAVALSSIAFPASVAWMAGAWLLAATFAAARGRRIAWWLAPPLVLLVIKRLDATWALVGLLTALGLSVAIDGWQAARGPAPMFRRMERVALALSWLALLLFAVDRHDAAHRTPNVVADRMRPVVVMGDSLSSSERLGHGYASDLRALIDRPVVDFSRPGISADEAAEDLPKLPALKPAIVVIELGGHDYLRGAERAVVRQRLVRLIEASLAAGAQVVLCEIPRGFISDPLQGLERELARQYGLELISDATIRDFVLFSPACPPGMWGIGRRLSEDGLHPNQAGNRHLAHAVAQAIGRIDPASRTASANCEGCPAR